MLVDAVGDGINSVVLFLILSFAKILAIENDPFEDCSDGLTAAKVTESLPTIFLLPQSTCELIMGAVIWACKANAAGLKLN